MILLTNQRPRYGKGPLFDFRRCLRVGVFPCVFLKIADSCPCPFYYSFCFLGKQGKKAKKQPSPDRVVQHYYIWILIWLFILTWFSARAFLNIAIHKEKNIVLLTRWWERHQLRRHVTHYSSRILMQQMAREASMVHQQVHSSLLSTEHTKMGRQLFGYIIRV